MRTFKRTVEELVTLHLAGAVTGQVVETIVTTSEHPFAVAGAGFVPADRLGIGNVIVTRAGPSLVVWSVARESRPEGYTVYNLEVEDYHTYFVGNTDGGVWVHNPAGCLTTTTPVIDVSGRNHPWG